MDETAIPQQLCLVMQAGMIESLWSDIVAKNADIEAMNTALSSERENVKQLTASLENSESENKKCNQEITTMQSTIQCLNSDLSSCQNKTIPELHNMIQSKDALLSDAEREIENLKEQLNEQNEDIQQIDSMKDEMDDLKYQNRQLQEANTRVQNDIFHIRQEVDSLQQEVDSLQQEVESKTKEVEQLSQQKSGLTNDLLLSRQQAQEMQNQIKALNQEMSRITNAKKTGLQQQEINESRIRSIEIENSQLRNTNQAIVQKVWHFLSENGRTVQGMETSNGIDAVLDGLSQWKEEMDQRTNEKENVLRKSMEAKEKEYKSTLANKEATLNDCKTTLESWGVKYNLLFEEYQQQKDMNAEMQKNLRDSEELADKAQEFNRQLTNANQAVSSMSMDLEKVSNELNQRTNELNACKQALSGTSNELNQRTNELNACKQALSGTSNELNQRTNELNTCKREMSQMLHNNEIFSQQMMKNVKEETAQAIAGPIRERDETIQRYMKETAELNRTIQNKTDEIESQQRRISELQQSLEQLNRKASELKNEREKTIQNLQATINAMNEKEYTHLDDNERISRLERENEEYRSKINTLRRALGQLKDSITHFCLDPGFSKYNEPSMNASLYSDPIEEWDMNTDDVKNLIDQLNQWKEKHTAEDGSAERWSSPYQNVENYQKEIADLRAQLRNAQENGRYSNDENVMLQQIEALQKMVNNQSSQLNELATTKETIKTQKHDIQILEMKIASLQRQPISKEEREAYETECNALKNDANEKAIQLRDLQIKYDNSCSQLNKSISSLKSLSEEYTMMKNDYEQSLKVVADLKSTKELQVIQLRNVERERDESNQLYSSLKKNVESEMEKLSEVTQKLRLCEQERDQYKEMVKNKPVFYDSVEWMNKLSEKEKRINELEAEKAAIWRQITTQKNDYESQKASLSQQVNELLRFLSQMQNERSSASTLHTQLQTKQHEVDEYKNKYEQVLSSNKYLKEQLQSEVNCVERCKIAVNELNQLMPSKDVPDMKYHLELQTKDEYITQLLKQVETMNTRIQELETERIAGLTAAKSGDYKEVLQSILTILSEYFPSIRIPFDSIYDYFIKFTTKYNATESLNTTLQKQQQESIALITELKQRIAILQGYTNGCMKIDEKANGVLKDIMKDKINLEAKNEKLARELEEEKNHPSNITFSPEYKLLIEECLDICSLVKMDKKRDIKSLTDIKEMLHLVKLAVKSHIGLLRRKNEKLFLENQYLKKSVHMHSKGDSFEERLRRIITVVKTQGKELNKLVTLFEELKSQTIHSS